MNGRWDPRGRAAECENGEAGRIQREEGREGGERDLRMMREREGEPGRREEVVLRRLT